MFLFYCDESGSYAKEKIASLLNQEEANRWYFLSALAVSNEERKTTFETVLHLKNTYIAPLAPLGKLHERTVEAELKGHELFQVLNKHKPQFKLWEKLAPNGAQELLDELLGKLTFLHGRLFVVAVDQTMLYRQLYRIAWPAPFIALTFLQQRACDLLNSVVSDPTQRFGVFLLDRGSAVEREFEVDAFLAARDSISKTAAYHYDYDRLLLETPVSAKSSDVAQLQVVDVLLHIVARAIRRDDPGDPWFLKASLFLAQKPTGKKLGAGITFYPAPAIPPAWAAI